MDGAINNIRQTENIEGVIKVLMKALADLAPHPDRPDYRGPLFVKVDSSFNPPAEYDGMMGSMMLDGMISMAFTSAASNNNIDIQNVVDCVDEYVQDRITKPSYKVGQRNCISGLFNNTGNREALSRAYYADLQKRLGLETNIAYHLRRLCSERKNALRYGRLQAA